jgi:hypothetical protein
MTKILMMSERLLIGTTPIFVCGYRYGGFLSSHNLLASLLSQVKSCPRFFQGKSPARGEARSSKEREVSIFFSSIPVGWMCTRYRARPDVTCRARRGWARHVAAGRRALSPVYHKYANIAARISQSGR